MSFDQKDVEIMERIVYKQSDDVAISIARSFERLEERLDASEARTYARIAELEDRIEASRQDTSDLIGELREEVREIVRFREM